MGERSLGGCIGVHMNMAFAQPRPEDMDSLTPAEQAFLAQAAHYDQQESAYARLQSTRPQTLGYALTDSPVGQAAWIYEKLRSWTDNEKVRRILQENLDDELGSGNPAHAHFLHYLHLLDDLGVERERFDRYQERPGIKLALSLAFNVARSANLGRSIGYMLVNEAMTPITYTAAKQGLTTYHPELGTSFFDLHIEVDEHHVAALYEAVDSLTESDREELQFGISLGRRGMEILLDEAYGVFDHHTEVIEIPPRGGVAPQPSPTPTFESSSVSRPATLCPTARPR